MEWVFQAIAIVVVFLALVFAGLPLAFSLGLVSVVGLLVLEGPKALFTMASIAYTYGTDFALIAVPLFILMAEVMTFTGVGADLYAAATRWFGRLPGGLAVASQAACALFAAASGTTVAVAAVVGTVGIPEMLKRDYDKALAAGCIVGGGTLGILIPPSVPMIVYGIAADASIGKLFIGGIIPGIVVTVLFSLYIMLRVMLKPGLAPLAEKASWADKFKALRKLWAIIVIIFAVLGAIYLGVATPSEAAATGTFAAMVIGLVYKRLNWQKLRPALVNSAYVSCYIFFIMFGAGMLNHLLTLLYIPQNLVGWIVSLEVSRWLIIVAINLLYLAMGCFLIPIAVIVLTVPILAPIITNLGFSPIWFGVMAVINMEVATITPPVGVQLFVVKGIAPQISLGEIIRGSMPFVLILCFTIVLVSIFPDLILYLPNRMK